MGISVITVKDTNIASKLPFYADYSSQYKLQFADIVTKLDVVSGQADSAIGKHNITEVTVGSNVSCIGVSCFADCTNLKNVTTYDKLKRIDDFAFTGCKSLTSVSFLDESNKARPGGATTVDYIGERAFSNTGLTAAYVPLRRSTGDTYIMPSAFADNQSLKHVENVMFNYLGPYEFANCRSLTSVVMSDYHAYSYECTFKDCVSLKHVTIPAKLWMIGDKTFQGCTSLTSVEFTDTDDNPSELCGTGCFGDYFLSGTAIKSLTFPSCVKDWTPFKTSSLGGMSKLKRIKFKGIPFSMLGKAISVKNTVVDTHHIFMQTSDSAKYNDTLTESRTEGDKIKNIAQYINYQSEPLENLADEYRKLNRPFMFIKTNVGCPKCHTLAKNLIYTKKFLNWIKNENDKCVIFYGYVEPPKFNVVTNGEGSGNNWPTIYMFGPNAKPFYHEQYYNVTPDEIISEINRICEGYSPPSDKVIYSVSMDILTTNVFGLKHSVMLEAMDGRSIKVTKSDATIATYDIEYEQEVIVDATTTQSKFFKFGQWYYNAKQLRQLADKYHIPMFIEIGSAGCSPCQDFHSIVFQDQTFQKFMSSSNMLLCRTVSNSSGWPGQCGYVYNWIGEHPKGTPKAQRYNQQGHMPVLYIHWNSLSGSIDNSNAEASPQSIDEFAWFDIDGQTTNENFPAMQSISDISSWVKQISAVYNMQTVPQQSQQAGKDISYFKKPSIGFRRNNGLSCWYKRYRFAADDTYGAYYPAKQRTPDNSQHTVYLSSIDVPELTSGIKQFKLKVGDSSSLPVDGVYQYFTTYVPSDRKSTEYDAFKVTYDISGIMFSVGELSSKKELPATYYDDGSFPSLHQFAIDNTLTASGVASSLVEHFYEVYKKDSSGSWTTNVDPDTGCKTGNGKYYNAICTYTTSRPDKLVVCACVSGEVKTTSSNKIVYKDSSSDALSVIMSTSSWIEPQGRKVQWLSSFRNDVIVKY